MDLKDMILVMENYKGTERNMLMTLEDYKKFVAIDDMSELADQMLLLGRTLAEGFTEYYSNVVNLSPKALIFQGYRALFF